MPEERRPLPAAWLTTYTNTCKGKDKPKMSDTSRVKMYSPVPRQPFLLLLAMFYTTTPSKRRA
jgi:hypothetical protein